MHAKTAIDNKLTNYPLFTFQIGNAFHGGFHGHPFKSLGDNIALLILTVFSDGVELGGTVRPQSKLQGWGGVG